MALEFQAAAARRMRRLVIALVVLVLVLAATVLYLAVGPQDDTSSRPSSPPSSPAPAADGQQARETLESRPVSTFTPDPTFVPPAQWVRLPKPSGRRLGLPTGYEHTPEGAAAATVSVVRTGITWDFDDADRSVQAYAAPADMERLRAAMRENVARSRSWVQLPASGPIPAAAHLTVAPIGVYWTVVDTDTIQVSVLVRETYATDSVPEKTDLRSTQYRMVWVDGDWHHALFAPSQSTRHPGIADLGSTVFNTQGWRAIQEGSSG